MRCDRAGELPLELIRMKAKGCKVELSSNKGFTLPSNIGELSDDITALDLSGCSLQGASCSTSSTTGIHTEANLRARGTFPRFPSAHAQGAFPQKLGN